MSRRPPDIEVHIEELVLHGLGAVDAAVLREALGRELARRLSAGPFSPGAALRSPGVQDIALPSDFRAADIGVELGRTLHAGLCGRGDGS
jgi:hypothetical protein